MSKLEEYFIPVIIGCCLGAGLGLAIGSESAATIFGWIGIILAVLWKKNKKSVTINTEKTSGKTYLDSFADDGTRCFANFRMKNGDPVFLSIAQTGVLIKKSTTGITGETLYEDKGLDIAKKISEGKISVKKDIPKGMHNYALKLFSHIILSVNSIQELKKVLKK